MLKGKLKKILIDHWDGFLKIYEKKVRENVKREVEKVIKCKDIREGYIEFKCEKCGEIKRVGFTCKSRFCSSCGKIYVDNWINSMLKKLINVRHRHIVFTIPKELRKYFGKDREKLKILPKCAAEAIMSWMREQNKTEEFEPGIVTVIHTFGRDLKWNPHVHMMVTEGGTGKKIKWRDIRYISYEGLRKRWQKLLMDEIENIIGEKREAREIKNKLYREKNKGFYVHAKTEIKSAKMAGKYIGRYVGRPAIAESRILKYDGEKVTFKYTRHEDNKIVIETVDAYEFIKKVIIHIPEKNFKMIRYYGIYARRSKKTENFIKMMDEKIMKLKKSMGRWEYRVMAAFGVDPLKCEKCKGTMRLNDIVYKNYGSVKEYLRKRIEEQTGKKLKEMMEEYGVTKGIIYGRMIPTRT